MLKKSFLKSKIAYIHTRALHYCIKKTPASLSLSLSLSNKISELTNTDVLINSNDDNFLNRKEFISFGDNSNIT